MLYHRHFLRTLPRPPLQLSGAFSCYFSTSPGISLDITVSKQYKVTVTPVKDLSNGVILTREKTKELLAGSLIAQYGYPDEITFYVPLNALLASPSPHTEGHGPQSEKSLEVVAVGSMEMSLATAAAASSTLLALTQAERAQKTGTFGVSYEEGIPELPGEGLGEVEKAMASRQPTTTYTTAKTENDKALLQAAETGDFTTLFKLLEAKQADLNVREGSHGATALHLLCGGPGVYDEGLEEALKAMVRYGADVNAVCANGSTPLHWAASSGSLAAVEILLSLGADATATTYTWRRQVFGKGSGQTAAHWAAESGYYDIVKALADTSVLSVVAEDERGTTPRALAHAMGHKSLHEALAIVEEEKYLGLHFKGSLVMVQESKRGQQARSPAQKPKALPEVPQAE